MGPELLSGRCDSSGCLDLTFSLHLWLALCLSTSRAWPRWRQRQRPSLTQTGPWTQRKRCFWEPPSYPHTRAGIYYLHIFWRSICIANTWFREHVWGSCCCLRTHEIKQRFSSKPKVFPKHLPKISLDGGGGLIWFLVFCLQGREITWKTRNRINCRGRRGGGNCSQAFRVSCSLSKPCARHRFN